MSQAYQIATPKYFGMLVCNALSVIGLCCLVYRAPTIQLFVVTISLSVIMMITSLWQICFYMRKMTARTFFTYLIYVANGWLIGIMTMLIMKTPSLLASMSSNWFTVDIAVISVIMSTAVSWVLLEDR